MKVSIKREYGILTPCSEQEKDRLLVNRIISVTLVCLLHISLAAASTFNLLVEVTPNGSGTLNISGGTYEEGSDIYLRTYNNTGYVFLGWYEGDVLLSSSANFNYTMPANDVLLQARYEYDPQVPDNPDPMVPNYTVNVACKPIGGGTFNTNSVTMEGGGEVHLYAYTNTGYHFSHWTNEAGDTISTEQNFYYIVPHGDSNIFGIFEYDPAVPGNPNKNSWDYATGEVIVDDFSAGSLGSAISSVIDGSDRSSVSMITVAGKMNDNDFGIANNYTNCTLLDLSRVTGITQVPSYAFDYTNLESVYLPATIETIGNRAFYECKQLSSLTIYAMIPPTLENGVFTNIPEGLVVYVPANAIAQYQEAEGWKDFTILPIKEDVRSLSVSLPKDCDINLYQNNVLELTNKQNGQRYRTIITKQSVYSFPYLIKHTKYDLKLLNGRDLVLGTINDISIENNDTAVVFSSLLQPQEASIKVLLPNGNEITDKVSITWKDIDGDYLCSGPVLDNVVEGFSFVPNIKLNKELAIEYTQPADVKYTVTSGSNLITLTLTTHPVVSFKGKVVNSVTQMPLEGAQVSVNQMINGKYVRTEQTRTDSKGLYMLTAIKGPATITHSSNNFLTINDTIDFTSVTDNSFLDRKELQPIKGFKVGVAFTLTPSFNEKEKAVPLVWSSGADDVSYEITNYTTGVKVNDFINQYPLIILPYGIEEGDSLLITAKARDNAFLPVTVGCKVSSNGSSVVFPFLELGQLTATHQRGDELNTIGILYDATGALVKKDSYTNGKLQMNDITDGEYLLVTMTQSTLFNSISRLEALSESGLEEGKDYLLNKVTLQSGKITEVENDVIPIFDDTRFNYTSSDAYFSVNKADILAGSFLTMQACLTFKDEYIEQIKNARILVELPEGTTFIDNSAMIGTKMTTYELDRNKLTISVDGHLEERIRFCVIPETEGKITSTAYACFTFNGREMKQPLGSVTYKVQSIAMNSPSTVCSPEFVVNGVVMSGATVDIYEDNILIGSTKALNNGVWSATCKLGNPRNLSSHAIHAVATTEFGAKVKTETKHVLYDKSALEVSKVHMYHWNPEQNVNYDVVFDFQNPSQSSQKYTYYIYNREFTFTIDFTSNDTTRISDVKLRVKTGNDSYVVLDAEYSIPQKCWVATGEFGNMYDGLIPRNVDVHYLCKNKPEVELEGFRDIISGDTQKELTAYKDAYLTFVKQALSLDDEQACDELFVNTFGTQEVCEEAYSYDELEKCSEEELLEMLDQSISEIISYNSDNESNQQEEILDEFDFVSNGYRFIRKRCEDLDSALLVQQGFIVIPSTDSVPLFCRTLDGVYEVVDFFTNIYLSIFAEKALARSRNSDSDESIVQSLSKDFSGSTFDMYFSVAENTADTDKLKLGRELRKAIRIRKMCKTRGYTKGLEKWTKNESDIILSIEDLGKNAAVIKALGKTVDYYGKYKSSEESVENTFDTWNLQNYLPDDLPVSYIDYEAIQQLKNDIRWKSADQATSHIIKYGVESAIVEGVLWSAAICPWSLIFTIPAALGTIYAVDDYFSDVTRNTYNQLKFQVSKYRDRLGLPQLDLDWESSGNPDNDVSIDPSGYVYEGVFSNRVEGVKATAFYKENVEDMFGDVHENIVKWNAEEYAQENPLFTDQNGYYRWDVPQGLWQVQFEKEGYETTYSEWLPVPPPQLEVNVGMVQNKQPEVKTVYAYEDGVVVEFDKYMQPATLNTDNIYVLQNGEKVVGTVTMLNEEVAYKDDSETYASKIRFVFEQSMTAEEIILTVSNRVKSYAGVRMQDTYTQTFDIEKEIKAIVADSLVTMFYGAGHTLTVKVIPKEAAAGKTLVVKSLTEMVLSVDNDSIVLDDNGEAVVAITGELPGLGVISYSLAGYAHTASTIVKVDYDNTLITANPTASIASGTTVEMGAEVILNCSTEGAAIYYTLDGSCPCDGTAILYDGTPIVINDNTELRIMAVAEGRYESDVVVYHYYVEGANVEDVVLPLGIHPTIIKNGFRVQGVETDCTVSVYGVSGELVLQREHVKNNAFVNIAHAPEGMYIVMLKQGDDIYKQRILKVE